MTHDGAEAIRKLLRAYPTASLSIKPTPIRLMHRMSARRVPGPRLWIMRDDLTGFALGGNKIRKLEYILGEALAKKANALVVVGATSFSRNAAAAGKTIGLEVHVLIVGEEARQNRLSREYFALMDATVHYVPDGEVLQERHRDLVDVLRARGRRVQELHPGGSDTIGTLGYVEAFAEIVERMAREGVIFERVFHATGSAATQAGLVLGQSISGSQSTRIVGVAISTTAEAHRQRVADVAAATSNMLGVEFDPAGVIVDDRYLGDGYAIPSADSLAAVDLFARTEGLLFDSVYAGKAAAALLGQVRSGELDATANVLLVHTGGNAGAYY